MSRTSTIYEVLIASPGDVPSERKLLADVVAAWNSANSRSSGIFLQPLLWELDSVPSIGGDGQTIINKQLVENADILIGVFWSRLGSPTKKAVSGTAEEIEHFRAKEKTVLLYFSEAPLPYKHDKRQLGLLEKYKKSLRSNTLYSVFSDIEELERKASKHLANVMSNISTSRIRGSISWPLDETRVSSSVTVAGTIYDLPRDHRPWLAVQLERGHIYPQCRLSTDQAGWRQPVRIGVSAPGKSKGEKFLIRLVSAGPTSDYQFQKHVLGESDRKDWLYMDWPADTIILDTKIVIRDD